MSKPFARVLAMFSLIAAAMGNSSALAAIGPYVSRGKGQGKFSGLRISHRQTTFKNLKVGGGDREVARRKRQIKSGMLRIA